MLVVAVQGVAELLEDKVYDLLEHSLRRAGALGFAPDRQSIERFDSSHFAGAFRALPALPFADKLRMFVQRTSASSGGVPPATLLAVLHGRMWRHNERRPSV